MPAVSRNLERLAGDSQTGREALEPHRNFPPDYHDRAPMAWRAVRLTWVVASLPGPSVTIGSAPPTFPQCSIRYSPPTQSGGSHRRDHYPATLRYDQGEEDRPVGRAFQPDFSSTSGWEARQGAPKAWVAHGEGPIPHPPSALHRAAPRRRTGPPPTTSRPGPDRPRPHAERSRRLRSVP